MSWKVIKELNENRAKTFADAAALRELANKEDRDLTAEEETRHVKMLADVDSYAKRIERETRAAALGESMGGDRPSPGRDDLMPLPEKDMRGYSLVRAIQRKIKGQELDGVEAEVHKEMELRSGRKAQGFFLPMQTRALDTTAGAGSVGTVTASNFIELLRNKLVMQSLGATVMADLSGKFSLPRQSGGATAYWVAESGGVTGSAQTLDQVAFAPKTVGAYTDISRTFFNESSIDVENFVRNDLALTIALALDQAAISGPTGGNNPVGIINTSGVGAVSHGTNGGAETWSKVVSYETAVLAANVDPSSRLSYISNSKVAGALKTTDKTSGGYGQFILGNDNKLNGYNFAVTNACPSNGTKGTGSALSSMIFGNFSDLVIGLWGALDVLIDPYTGGASGTTRIRVLQDADIEVRHPASFAIATDIIA